MSSGDVRRALRERSATWPVVLVAGVFVVMAVAGQSFGRAEPTGSYRPPLVADTLRLGCYPLPDGVTLDFPYVVRSDSDAVTAAGERRLLVLHWSLLDLDQVRERLREAFTRSGFEVTGRSASGTELVMTRSEPGGGSTRAAARFTMLDNRSPDPIVRGVVELDLPVVALSSGNADCANPFVTKRFAQDR
ncbi:hypothetical protein ABLE68_15660 [Nocardioides sp. CN2-186]|uniref:hypothetical protein n=1 Tax=Nocardioides tweenelious TaxID=3156607 RepID=UPI0032B380E7